MSKPIFKLISEDWSQRYNVEDRQFRASFEINSKGRITFFESWGTGARPKDYHFEESKLDVVLEVTGLIRTCVKYAKEVLKTKQNMNKKSPAGTSPTKKRVVNKKRPLTPVIEIHTKQSRGVGRKVMKGEPKSGKGSR